MYVILINAFKTDLVNLIHMVIMIKFDIYIIFLPIHPENMKKIFLKKWQHCNDSLSYYYDKLLVKLNISHKDDILF